MEWLASLTGVAIALEVVAALVISWLNIRETRYLRHELRPLLLEREDLPLLDALTERARWVTAIGWYLIIFTALGAAGIVIVDFFPPIRAINAGLLLYLIAGPRIVGMALRKTVPEHPEEVRS